MSFQEFIEALGCGKYKIIRKIGEGGFGKVLLAELKDDTHNNHETINQFALKIFPLHTDSQEKTYRREEKFSRQLKHKNIVQFHESYTVMFAGVEYGILVYERMDIDLLEYYNSKQDDGGLEENELKFIFQEMSKAILYCHRNHIAHLDIKPENFLIRFKYTATGKKVVSSVKLCDFGFAKNFKPKNSKITMYSSKIGTKEYKAPELNKTTISKYLPKTFNAEKIDIWSLGVTLFVLCTGYFPEASQVIIDSDDIGGFNPAIAHLLRKMMDIYPPNRPRIFDIMSHPWVFGELHDFEVVKETPQNISHMIDDQTEIRNSKFLSFPFVDVKTRATLSHYWQKLFSNQKQLYSATL